MDGENHGNPYEQMDDLGGKPTIFGNIHVELHSLKSLQLIFMIRVDGVQLTILRTNGGFCGCSWTILLLCRPVNILKRFKKDGTSFRSRSVYQNNHHS